MDMGMNPVPDEESAVVDFAMQLLRTMSYAGRALGRYLRSRKAIPLYISGKWVQGEVDVCLMSDNDEYILLVQEDERHIQITDPESQLIAKAIAAVQSNNRTR